MRRMMVLCVEYANEYSVKFSHASRKQKRFVIQPSSTVTNRLDFQIGGYSIEIVAQWPHNYRRYE